MSRAPVSPATCFVWPLLRQPLPAACILALLAMSVLLPGCAARVVQLAPERERAIRTAVESAGPWAVQFDVSALQKWSQRYPAIIISGHLLADATTYDPSPYVRGNYTTHERLMNTATERTSAIFRSIISSVGVDSVSELVVEIRHGVRVRTVFGGSGGSSFVGGGTDQSLVLFAVSLRTSKHPTSSWLRATPEQMAAEWRITQNIIPSLQFEHEWYRR